jgi:hypothetical protein
MIFQMVYSQTFKIILFITIIQITTIKYTCVYGYVVVVMVKEGPISATYPWVVSVDLQNRMSTARKKSCRQNHGTDVFCMQK